MSERVKSFKTDLENEQSELLVLLQAKKEEVVDLQQQLRDVEEALEKLRNV